ncbi:hypothetical protein [Pelagimonas varians]|uniref:Uncharacterized protein n=1 Tax=Pelagimonas varians TaxID=696760 RepID=A0A238KF57_9RHOB|nr:hypothetical protein [Pelagimonas varians]PYG32398.1 hypothetical protein C8N36_103147 [Pelagimonas varians]SMX41459.1 hypothetical protein PEV8663_02282 [Pelagimonas varians]
MRQVPKPAAMAIRLNDSPWQHLPEMSQNYQLERAGIEAGLLLVEMFHHHGASRLAAAGYAQAAKMRLGAAVAAASLRADIVGIVR